MSLFGRTIILTKLPERYPSRPRDDGPKYVRVVRTTTGRGP